MPSAAIASIPATSMTTGESRERREGANGDHVAMRKLDDVKNAKKQRKADSDERIHHAEHQPVHDVLSEQRHIHVFVLTVLSGKIAERGCVQPRPVRIFISVPAACAYRWHIRFRPT